MALWCAYIYIYVFISEDIYMYTTVYIYIKTGVHGYTSACWRQLNGYWVSEGSPSHFPNQFPTIHWESVLWHYPETSVVTLFWKHCFPITTPASYMLWHVLVCRKPNSRHPTQRWERSGLNHKEVEILYIVTVQQQIQALNTISIFILTCSRTMGESFSSLESRTKLFTDLTRIGHYLTF